RVNAGNAALTPSAVRLAINKVRKALGINHLSKLIAYMAVEQEHAWENLGITVSQIIKEGGDKSGNDLDLLFSGRKTMSGVPIKSGATADRPGVASLILWTWDAPCSRTSTSTKSTATRCSRSTAPAAASLPASSSTSTPRFKCGTTRRVPARSSTP